MSAQETIRRVAAELDLPQALVRQVLTSTADLAERSLAAGERVTLPGIGVLEARYAAPRVVRSIADSRKTWIGGRYAARFRPSARVRKVLDARAPADWRSPEQQAAWRLAETLVADLDLYHRAKAPSLAEDSDVDAACVAAFGDLWTRARSQWLDRVPAAVVESHDHLASAALARWGA